VDPGQVRAAALPGAAAGGRGAAGRAALPRRAGEGPGDGAPAPGPRQEGAAQRRRQGPAHGAAPGLRHGPRGHHPAAGVGTYGQAAEGAWDGAGGIGWPWGTGDGHGDQGMAMGEMACLWGL